MYGFTLSLTIILTIGLTGPAWAYLDPGTGSMAIQILIGLVAGALVTLKLYWGKLKSFFGGTRNPDSEEDAGSDMDYDD